MTQMQDMPLLIVSLIVFLGLIVFLLGVDSRVRRMERELRDEIAAGITEDNATEKNGPAAMERS
jgi:hypothetical protein